MAYNKRRQPYKSVQDCERAILPYTKSSEACLQLFSIGAYDHGKENHQGLSNADLTRRAQDDKTKNALSTFYRPMETLLCSALKANYKQIAQWFVNPPGKDDPGYIEDEYDEDSFKLTVNYSHPIGHGIDTATRSDYDCRVASFIIKRDDLRNGGIGIRIKTAFPDIEKALEYERDADRAGLVTSNGHYCYDRNFAIHDITEMAAAKTQGAKFAIIASVMNNWQPDYDLLGSNNEDRLAYYDSLNDSVVLKAAGAEFASIILRSDFRIEATMRTNGKFVSTKPTTVTAKYPELSPYMDKLIELVHMAKDKSVSIDEPETISEAEDAGRIKYLDTTHDVGSLSSLKTQTKVSITFPDTLEFADGYILQADNFKNRQKTNETIFVYQSTGERRTLEPEGFGIEYTIREYDSIPGPNAGERPVEDHATTNEQPSHDLGKDTQTQSFDER